jgi:hypothetical protein
VNICYWVASCRSAFISKIRIADRLLLENCHTGLNVRKWVENGRFRLANTVPCFPEICAEIFIKPFLDAAKAELLLLPLSFESTLQRGELTIF